MATDYGAICSEGSSLTHARTRVNPVHRKMRSWGCYIGKYAGRAAENVVLNLDPFIDRDIVLDADTAADMYVIGDIDVLAQGAVFPDDSAGLYMAEVPYFCAFAYLGSVIDVAAFVYKEILHLFSWVIQRSRG